MKFSVIMPVERAAGDAQRAIRALLDQNRADFELILVGTDFGLLPEDRRIVAISEADRNPARRRNRAAGVAKGEILAFIDDDAFARPDWLANAAEELDGDPGILVLGGPDPAPDDSSLSELISDTLLAAPMIGSGIACHEGRSAAFDVRSPHDLALVNLFVRTAAFREAGGFDERIGYIGEDTDLIRRLMSRGKVRYSPRAVVFHRRRSFPSAYLRQRFRYRVKSGELMIRGAGYAANPKILAFLGAALFFAVALVFVPWLALLLAALYFLVTLALGTRKTRLPMALWPAIPLFFAMHHGTYLAGLLVGLGKALLGGGRPRPPS